MLSLSNGSWSHEKRWSHCQRRKMRNTPASSPLFPPSNLHRQLETPEQKPGNSLGRWVRLMWCRAEQQKPKLWIWGQKVLMSPAMGGPEFLPLLAPVHTVSSRIQQCSGFICIPKCLTQQPVHSSTKWLLYPHPARINSQYAAHLPSHEWVGFL